MAVREIVWGVVALLVAYAALELYRALRSGRASSAGPAAGPASAAGAPPAATGADSPRPSPGHEPASRPDAAAETASSAPESASASTAGRAEAFQSELELRQLRRDVVRLQEEAADHRRELADLTLTVRTLKEQLDAQLASQSVSPEYNEALVFARRGLDVEAIAERCGISVAEAELVRALAQRGGGEPGESA